jgi:NAD(P)-dependent dehydrogenase (short-subunit alcohol dehydrogenase family)
MLERGDTVVGIDLKGEEVPRAHYWIEGDAGDADTWRRLADILADIDRPVDNLVYGAAHLSIGRLLDLDDADWQRTLDVNVIGVARCLRVVLPGMIKAGKGSVVTIGSIVSVMAEQGLIAYCTSKGGIAQFTRTLAMDYARDGIRANCLCPGVTDTPLFRRHLASASDPEKWLRTRENRNPTGRLLSSEEVADAICFLCSEKSAGMTGSIMMVDGGITTSFDFRTGEEGA